ncbi:TetR/AcrR family transcriptional regulator C-terminal domain-containing protein [Nonomuraea endophytica]|uniref:DNA-binding transcriptional regulator YhcF (GntR family) n=1 Tax=Nonomuraea endophytica TaxID=714136 RepID=A0A7W7ZWU4_9ACTN|nr:TetR/AcrR family transcriptional regulator C-terminal domain-containing protein [Nonomuraea endophytica]MBB5075239.1 DNA-binding transcriptional regulator YhcF (GntR family) [Nonomuraea endophytica]
MTPPYIRIVADIKRRVAEGELKPGDKVPSTRGLARDWNVALATAAKALTLLAQEGVITSEPRVGSTVAGGPARDRTPTPSDLTRERIVRIAIEIADAEGLAALSMRGIAAKTGAATMSLYRHVGGKEDLVRLMADAAYGEFDYPLPLPEGWRARFELSARGLWALYRRHPWLPHVTALTRPLIVPNLMRHAEYALASLDGYGLDALTRQNIHVLVYNYVQGVAVHLEREAQQDAATGMGDDEWMDAQGPGLAALEASGAYPHFAAVVAGLGDDYDLDLDAFFEFGLTPLLNGLATLIEPST